MREHRNGEQGSIPERNERFFTSADYWYYTTREGVDIGPFDTYEDARRGADDFIEFIQGVEPSFSRTLKRYGRKAA